LAGTGCSGRKRVWRFRYINCSTNLIACYCPSPFCLIRSDLKRPYVNRPYKRVKITAMIILIHSIGTKAIMINSAHEMKIKLRMNLTATLIARKEGDFSRNFRIPFFSAITASLYNQLQRHVSNLIAC